MSNYTKTTNFTSKDSLPSGNSDKIVKGSEIDTEFNNIQTAVATKLNTNDGALTGTTTFQTLSDGTISITAFVDEDNMASDSATLLPTQQSVKAYVDSQVTAQDLDFQADTGGALSIDLDSETLTFTGGTGVDTSGSGNAVTFAIDSTVATLTGTQTLSNKTLSTPVISGNLTTNGLIDGRDVATDGTKLDGIESGATGNQTAAEIKTAYESNADTNAFTDADHSKLDGIEASADVTDTANVTAAGALMDSELTAIASVKALNQGVATTDSPTFAGLTLGATALTATAAELNVLDGITSTTAELNILDGVTATTAELNILDGVTSTAAELNILDGVTATATELNYVDGVTSAIQTQLDAKAALAGANFTGNVDVAGTLTTDAFSIEDATSPTLTLNDTTSANQKTTLSHTAGASVLTTGDNGVFGSFKVAAFDGTSTINRLLIADNGDVSLYEDGGATAKLVWDSSAEALEFADNAKAIFGAGSDLQIYHDSSDSIIDDNGTGSLKLQQGGSTKLEVTTTGINVTGDVDASANYKVNGTLLIDSSMNLQNLNLVQVATGSSTAPSIRFTGDTNTGFARPAADTLGFITGGSEAMRIDSSGNVGIGVSSLVTGSSRRILQVSTGSDGGQIAFADSTTEAANPRIFATNKSDLKLASANSGASTIQFITGTTTPAERMRIDSSGAVIFKGSLAAHQTNAGTAEYESNIFTLRAYGATSGTGQFRVLTGGGGGSAASEAMRIDASGNVGIGTTPSGFLTTGYVLRLFGGSQTLLTFNNSTHTTQATGGFVIGNDGSNAYVIQRENQPLAFYTNDVERMRIEASGAVSITGSLSKGSGSFKIDHPLPAKAETHHLVHSFVEAPQADNIYRGKVDLVGGSATVNIDTAAGMTEGTFVLLNTNTQCFTSNESGWTAVKGSVSGNTLTITAQDNTCTDKISWMVVGERHDQHMIDTDWTDDNGKVIVEPLKENN